MKLTKISAACALAAGSLFGASAQAQISGDVIKIGFITDMSGLYADIDGPAGAEAIKMAIADMGGAINGKKIGEQAEYELPNGKPMMVKLLDAKPYTR